MGLVILGSSGSRRRFYERMDVNIENVIPEHLPHIRVNKDFKISPFRRESKLGNGQCFTNGNPKVDWMTGFAKSKLTLCQGQEDDEILGTTDFSRSSSGSALTLRSSSLAKRIKSYLDSRSWSSSCWWISQRIAMLTWGNPSSWKFNTAELPSSGEDLLGVLKCIPLTFCAYSSSPGFFLISALPRWF